MALAELSSPSGCAGAGWGPGQAAEFLLVPSKESLVAPLWSQHVGLTSQHQHGHAEPPAASGLSEFPAACRICLPHLSPFQLGKYF